MSKPFNVLVADDSNSRMRTLGMYLMPKLGEDERTRNADVEVYTATCRDEFERKTQNPATRPDLIIYGNYSSRAAADTTLLPSAAIIHLATHESGFNARNDADFAALTLDIIAGALAHEKSPAR